MKRFICLALAMLMCFSATLALTACDDDHTHSYGEWETGVEATCTSKGVKSRTCSCGQTESEEIPATGEHHFDENDVCAVCAHSHVFGAWQEVITPTCTNKGKQARHCACGASQVEDIPAKPHTYENRFCTVCRGFEVGRVELKVDENGVKWAQDYWGDWREYDNIDLLDGYQDEPVYVLYPTGGDLSLGNEFVQPEPLDDARLFSVYERNQTVQARLGVKLVFVSEPGVDNNAQSFALRVKRARDAQTNEFDLIASCPRAYGAMLSLGVLQDISAIEESYIELDKPWWPRDLSRDLSINGALYAVTGEISMSAVDKMASVYFNKQILDDKFASDAAAFFAQNPHKHTPQTGREGGDTASNMLYEKVLEGSFTIDDLIYLASDSYVDTLIDGVVSVDDWFGLCSKTDLLSALYGASDLRMIEAAAGSSVLKVSQDWTSEKAQGLVQKLSALLTTNSYFAVTTTKSFVAVPFERGKATFFVGYIQHVEDMLYNDFLERFGVLPMPKYQAAQPHYYTMVKEYSLFSVFAGFDARGDAKGTLTMLSAVLECWASEAYRKTTPTILKTRVKWYGADKLQMNVCEIIRSGMRFDMGRVFDSCLSKGVCPTFTMDGLVIQAAEKNIPWEEQYPQYLDYIEDNLAVFVASLQPTLVK